MYNYTFRCMLALYTVNQHKETLECGIRNTTLRVRVLPSTEGGCHDALGTWMKTYGNILNGFVPGSSFFKCGIGMGCWAQWNTGEGASTLTRTFPQKCWLFFQPAKMPRDPGKKNGHGIGTMASGPPFMANFGGSWATKKTPYDFPSYREPHNGLL